jgi:basic membrane protein A
MRGTALAAAAMAGVLALAGCAKDSAGGSSNNSAAPSSGGSDCVTAQKPPAAPAASSSTAAAGGKVDGSALKIGLAFDVGGRGDASFNDAAAAGTDKAKSDLGVTTVNESTASASEAESAKQQRLDQMASQGLNPIVAVGFAYADSVKAVAA